MPRSPSVDIDCMRLSVAIWGGRTIGGGGGIGGRCGHHGRYFLKIGGFGSQSPLRTNTYLHIRSTYLMEQGLLSREIVGYFIEIKNEQRTHSLPLVLHGMVGVAE